ncbi:helix-turn-helix transcriptional regulator [Streptomyces sp. TRM66268-LWL]|uniref:Helix-turn-helix transcriptional regulator n=2 Tax=Streptomyces polyasparticus TaxID=2767826 RepID=A0ABR7SBS1_9ACTN|nr:helix-turn-helix transcriptional regulator [Streptomyces polyasparticus]
MRDVQDTRGVHAVALGAGRLRVTRRWPDTLRPYLRSYAGYWDAAATPFRVRIVPSGRAVVLLSLGEPFAQVHRLAEREHDPGVRVVGSLIAGLEDGPRIADHPGGQEAIRLELTPLGAYRLFALPMRELTNTVVELTDVLGPRAGELVERLSHTRDWAERFDLLDAALLRRLAEGPEPAAEVAHAWQLLERSGGNLPVARIAQETGWSHGYLVRKFTQQVGLTPKTAGRVLRFHRATGLMARGAVDLSALTAACGFYDQAHLNREFRALAAITPGQIAAARMTEGAVAL